MLSRCKQFINYFAQKHKSTMVDVRSGNFTLFWHARTVFHLCTHSSLACRAPLLLLSPPLEPEDLLAAAAAAVLELAPQRRQAVQSGAIFQRPLRDCAPLPQQLHNLILLGLPLCAICFSAHLQPKSFCLSWDMGGSLYCWCITFSCKAALPHFHLRSHCFNVCTSLLLNPFVSGPKGQMSSNPSRLD